MKDRHINKETMLKVATVLIGVAMALTLCCACACSGDEGHVHSIYDVEAVAPTCVSEGNIAYSYCIYCGEVFVDGKEADMSNIVLAKDPDNHAEPVEYPYVAASCSYNGVKAHIECEACGEYVLDGVTVTADDLVIEKDSSAHKLTHTEETAATCSTPGFAAHDKCDLCGKYFINGIEVDENDITTAVNPDNHVLQSLEAREASCYEDGWQAHDECTECGKWFVGGVETEKATLSIPAAHDDGFANGNDLECSECGAYKMLYNGQYYVVDETNRHAFTENELGASHSSSQDYRIDNIESLLENKMTFSTQLGSTSCSAAATEDGGWVITNTEKEFTRFSVSQDGSTGYVGKFILVFDVSVSSKVSVKRLGAGVAYAGRTDGAIDGAVTFYNGLPCGIIGSNGGSSGKNGAGIKTNVTLSADETYRMMILVETAEAEDVLVQIVTEMDSTTLTLSDLHIIFLDDEEATLDEGGMENLIYFGSADSSVYTKESCAHEWASYQSGKCYACGDEIT